MRFWGETNPHETIEGPKSKEKVIAWVGLSYECGVIGPFFFEDTEGKSDTVKTANYLEMIKKKVIHLNFNSRILSNHTKLGGCIEKVFKNVL